MFHGCKQADAMSYILETNKKFTCICIEGL